MDRSLVSRKTAFSLIQLLLIGGVLYALTHNKYAKPTPTITKGNWTIEKAVYPLLGGLAGHNYIILRDGAGSIQKEFHGLPTDPVTGKYRTISFMSGDSLKAYEFSYPVFTSRTDVTASETVISGNEKAVKKIWKQGETCVRLINAADITYPQLGVSFMNETINTNTTCWTYYSGRRYCFV